MIFFSPLEQFEIIPFFSFLSNYHVWSITNQTYFLCCVFLILYLTYLLAVFQQQLLPVRLQILCERICRFVKELLVQNVGSSAVRFFPLIFLVLNFVIFSNLVGRVPYSFTVTSHIIVTFALALSLFIGINILGVRKHGIVFLELFLPPGAPLIRAPLFVAIELISYFARVFSLSIRLFANITSGHALLKILAGFVWTRLFSRRWLKRLSLLPLVIVVAVTFLETAIALLQAYVFTILTCLYLNDALTLAH